MRNYGACIRFRVAPLARGSPAPFPTHCLSAASEDEGLEVEEDDPGRPAGAAIAH